MGRNYASKVPIVKIVRIGSILIMVLLWSCNGISDRDRNNLIAEAETAGLQRAYKLHEQLYLSTIPSDGTIAEIVARHGQPARVLALYKAKTGTRDSLDAAIPVILATRDSLRIKCSEEDVRLINNNISRHFGAGELAELERKRILNACGDPVSPKKTVD